MLGIERDHEVSSFVPHPHVAERTVQTVPQPGYRSGDELPVGLGSRRRHLTRVLRQRVVRTALRSALS